MEVLFLLFIAMPWWIWRSIMQAIEDNEERERQRLLERLPPANEDDEPTISQNQLNELIEEAEQREEQEKKRSKRARQKKIKEKGGHLRVVDVDHEPNYFEIDENAGLDDDAWE